jgi:hypothetical protein
MGIEMGLARDFIFFFSFARSAKEKKKMLAVTSATFYTHATPIGVGKGACCQRG